MPPYRHSHIVPAGYLRAWATNDIVGVGWCTGRTDATLPVKEVGVRSGFYEEERSDGSAINRLDPAMAVLEDKALQVLRSIEDRWPPSGTDRGRVAEFVALQLMRGPAWRDWYGDAIDNAAHTVQSDLSDQTEIAIRRARDFMRSDRARHERIVGNLPAMGTVLGNMHWTLLRCGAPRLGTSDHPVVPVPLGEGDVLALNPVPQGGALNTLEIRFAISPRLVLLMSWVDDFESEPIIKMKVDQVRNHNATVIEQADVQWFYVPGRRPERMTGPWPPFSYVLHGARHNPRGLRWHQVRYAIDEMSDAGEGERDIRLIEWGIPRTRGSRRKAA